MDFLDIINARSNAELDKEQQKLFDDVEHAAEVARIRADIIGKKIAAFADSLAMEHLRLSSISPDMYIVGGFVFSVRIHGMIDPDKRREVARSEVLWQHLIYLVGFDLTERTQEVRVGTLALLNFDGVRNAYDRYRDSLNFNSSEVITRIKDRS